MTNFAILLCPLVVGWLVTFFTSCNVHIHLICEHDEHDDDDDDDDDGDEREVCNYNV